MAQAARKQDLDLETNGLVRAVVFPNAIRDVRKDKGFDTLREFATRHDKVKYTRLAKIERGEVIPAGTELATIAKALRVPVGRLLVDTSDPEFSHDSWARSHIEGKIDNRGGDLEAMLIGAAVRFTRYDQEISPEEMRKMGLPVATLSRIENAERPFERWEGEVQRSVAKLLGVQSLRQTVAAATALHKKGKLDEILQQLFSPTALRERNNRRLRALLSGFPNDPVASRIMKRIDQPASADDLQDQDGFELGGSFASLPALGSAFNDDGSFVLAPSGQNISVSSDVAEGSVAIKMIAPVLGPGLPVGSILIMKRDAKISSGDVVALFDEDEQEAFILSATHDGEKLTGFSMMSDKIFDLSELGTLKTARMTSVMR